MKVDRILVTFLDVYVRNNALGFPTMNLHSLRRVYSYPSKTNLSRTSERDSAYILSPPLPTPLVIRDYHAKS